MFGHFSYLLSILFFAGPVIVFVWLFGFHLLKRYSRVVFVAIAAAIPLALLDSVAYQFKSWLFDPAQSLPLHIFGTQIESCIAAVFIAVAVSSTVIVWTEYEDLGKSIFIQSIKDILHAKYAIWKKSPYKKLSETISVV